MYLVYNQLSKLKLVTPSVWVIANSLANLEGVAGVATLSLVGKILPKQVIWDRMVKV